MSLGWSWDYIDEFMTLPRLYALNAYWEDHPPLHVLAAAWMGYKGKKGGDKNSWVARGLTVAQAIEEASKPHQMPANVTDFASDLASMGMGFPMPKIGG